MSHVGVLMSTGLCGSASNTRCSRGEIPAELLYLTSGIDVDAKGMPESIDQLCFGAISPRGTFNLSGTAEGSVGVIQRKTKAVRFEYRQPHGRRAGDAQKVGTKSPADFASDTCMAPDSGPRIESRPTLSGSKETLTN